MSRHLSCPHGHRIFIGEILAGCYNEDGRPLLSFGGEYRKIAE